MKRLKRFLTVLGMIGIITSIGLMFTGCAEEKKAEEEIEKVETMQDTTMQDTTAVDTMQQ